MLDRSLRYVAILYVLIGCCYADTEPRVKYMYIPMYTAFTMAIYRYVYCCCRYYHTGSAVTFHD